MTSMMKTLVASVTCSSAVLFGIGTGLAGTVTTSAAAAAQVQADGPRDARVDRAPTAITRIVEARPFRVDRAFRHDWRQERPEVTGGWLLVLEVDRDLLLPTQRSQPVLFAGRETAARANVGWESGRLVVIVPDRIGRDGRPATDLGRLPIWFGDADLPERVNAARITAERRDADLAGIAARPEAERATAIERGAEGVDLDERGVAAYADRMDLMRAAMQLVIEHAPDEREMAEMWLLTPETPVTDPAPRPNVVEPARRR